MNQPQNDCEWVAHHLPWYLNETLDPSSVTRMASHLENCQACRQELDETRWSMVLFNQHLPISILEAMALDSMPKDAPIDVVHGHLDQCESCSEQLRLMKSSLRQLLATPAPDVKPPKRFAWGWVPALAAALMIMALGLGWWSSYRSLKSMTARPPAAKSTPQANLVSKDLFPIEMARRNNADPLIETFEGFHGLALTLHSQLPESAQPFHLEIKTEAGEVLWHDETIVGQADGLVALFVPAELIEKGPLTLTLSVPDSDLAEHYRLDTRSNR